jgi:hypothetical protein
VRFSQRPLVRLAVPRLREREQELATAVETKMPGDSAAVAQLPRYSMKSDSSMSKVLAATMRRRPVRCRLSPAG